MSGVIPSPSGRRGSGSVVTPGGQVVAYHTRTNVSASRLLRGSCEMGLLDRCMLRTLMLSMWDWMIGRPQLPSR